MELLYSNLINTATQFEVNDSTATAVNVLNPDVRFQFSSNNFASDLTTVTMRVNFNQTVTVDRIAMVGHNLKDFTVYYDGVTANTFALDPGANTAASAYSSNSATSHYFRTTPVACTSVSIDMKKTILADSNKYLGYLVLSEVRTDFDGRAPSSDGYQPVINTQSVTHNLSDGGTRIQTLEDKWAADLHFDYVTESARDDLKTIFDDHEEMVFCPFGTTTGWDAVIFPCVWQGAFDFFQYSDNASDSGFSGSIRLLETPS